ncbi:MAG: hypothetical protein ACYTFK_14435 [Planctomycetota bacterium]
MSRADKKHIGKNIGDAVMNEPDIKNPKVGKVWKALWSGEAQLDDYAKYAEESRGALPNDINDIRIPFAGGKKLGETRAKLPRGLNLPIGNLIRLPFHGLTAGDELFKTLNFRASMYELSYREVMKTGKKMTPEEMDKAVKFQMENPTDEMLTESLRSSRYETFTNELDQFTGGFEKMLNAPGIGPTIRMLAVPFYKVTVNLPKYALQQTPLGYVAKWQKEAWKQGGKARLELMSRWAMGMSVMGAAFTLYELGLITGRVSSKERGAAEASNVQPYSFVHPETGEQYDYSRIEPLAYLAGMSADLGKAWDITMDFRDPAMREAAELELHDVMLAWGSAFVAPILEKSVMRSVKEVTDAALAPERMNWEKQGVKQVEKFMPRLFNFASEMTGNQEVMREARSVMEAWYRKWGTLADKENQAHPKRHIVYGTVVPREERAFGVINKKTYTDDPVLQELWRINANVTKVPDKFTFMGEEVDLSDKPDLYDKYQDEIAKSGMKEELERMINDEWYQSLTDQKMQAKILQDIISAYREMARVQLMIEDEDFEGVREEVDVQQKRTVDILIGKKYRKDKNAIYNYWSDKLNLRSNE